MQLRQLHGEIGRRLEMAGIDEPRREAALILANVLGIEFAAVYTRSSMEINESQTETIRQTAQRRANHEPLAYLLGRVCFMDLEFAVGRGVLVPRPDSEVLVETALSACLRLVPDKLTVLDACTGTGCVGISLAVHLRRAGRLGYLWLTEIDRNAAAYARKNIALQQLGDLCSLEIADLVPAAAGLRWDLIVANPPYIASSDIELLMPEVSVQEPRAALDGGSDGLDFYRRLIALAADRLSPGGVLLVEHGFDQAEAVAGLLRADGRYELLPTVVDYGGQPRVSGGFLPTAQKKQGGSHARAI